MPPSWFERRLIVCVGGGGVGKTTVSAAIGLAAALAGRRVLVLTVDPARRLAGALGLPTLPAQPAPVPASALAAAGLPPTLALSAMMLDQPSAWDRLLARHASAEVRRRLMASRFYQVLSRRFAGTTEYLAIDELAELAGAGQYDLLVLDTPPGERAIELLDAPERIRSLLDRRVLGWLPIGRSLNRLGRAGAFVASELEAATGGAALADLAGFLSATAELADVLSARAAAARAVLADPATGVLLVCAPDAHGVTAATALAARVQDLGLHPAGAVVNRTHAVWPEPVTARSLEAELGDAGLGADAAWLVDNFLAHERRARGEAAHIAELAARYAALPLSAIPDLDADVHDLRGLARMAASLDRDDA
jgi:anion-transporting  ArsA/GET3 family ATPase